MLGFHSMSNFSVSLCGRHHSTQVPLCSTANVSLGMSELGVRDQQCSATGACGVNAWPPPVPHWGASGGAGGGGILNHRTGHQCAASLAAGVPRSSPP